ncbi:hypothetical protein [Streptomyces cellulosae]|uniref:Uncharacterized protein n=1 Tax=Streptomyces cellulosae TaxID=1968 RepID=A0ABW7YCM9_STRCE
MTGPGAAEREADGVPPTDRRPSSSAVAGKIPAAIATAGVDTVWAGKVVACTTAARLRGHRGDLDSDGG